MALNFPQNPTNGQTYNGYVYSSAVGAWQAKPAAQSPFYTSDTPPANPITGDSWFNTNDGTMYIYTYDGNTYQWVEHRSQIAKSQVGLVPLSPTSVVVSSGTATVTTLGTVDFTGAASVSLNGIFTSAYKKYRIVATVGTANTGGAGLLTRLRTGGTDRVATYYRSQMVVNPGSPSTITASYSTSSDWGYVGDMGTNAAGANAFNMDVTYPAHAQDTFMLLNFYGEALYYRSGGLLMADSNIYDGITFYPNASTISGSITIYGYNG